MKVGNSFRPMDVIGPKVTQLSLTRAEFGICNPFSVGPFVVVSSRPTRDSVGTNVRRIERRKRCARGRDASAISAHGTRERMYPNLCLRKGERLRNVPSALLQLHSSPWRSKVDLWELLFVFFFGPHSRDYRSSSIGITAWRKFHSVSCLQIERYEHMQFLLCNSFPCFELEED
jgi:hypothetical protein